MSTVLRTLPWRAFGLVTAAAAVVVARWPEVFALRLAAVLLAAGAALFCDDPAEVLADATPTPRRVRRAARWLVAGGAAYAAFFAMALLVDAAPLGALARDLAMLLAVALAAGTALGGVAGAPALAVLLMAHDQVDHWLTESELLACAVALGVLASALRDPARRTA